MGNPASFSTASTIRSSMIWNTLELGVSQVLTIVVFILLTYRLPPEIFGIFALGAFFIDFLYTQAQTAAIDVLLLEDKIAKQRLNKLYGKYRQRLCDRPGDYSHNILRRLTVFRRREVQVHSSDNVPVYRAHTLPDSCTVSPC